MDCNLTMNQGTDKIASYLSESNYVHIKNVQAAFYLTYNRTEETGDQDAVS